MKVRHLIAKLKKFDLDMQVFTVIEDDEDGYPILDVEQGEIEDENSVDDVIFLAS